MPRKVHCWGVEGGPSGSAPGLPVHTLTLITPLLAQEPVNPKPPVGLEDTPCPQAPGLPPLPWPLPSRHPPVLQDTGQVAALEALPAGRLPL